MSLLSQFYPQDGGGGGGNSLSSYDGFTDAAPAGAYVFNDQGKLVRYYNSGGYIIPAVSSGDISITEMVTLGAYGAETFGANVNNGPIYETVIGHNMTDGWMTSLRAQTVVNPWVGQDRVGYHLQFRCVINDVVGEFKIHSPKSYRSNSRQPVLVQLEHFTAGGEWNNLTKFNLRITSRNTDGGGIYVGIEFKTNLGPDTISKILVNGGLDDPTDYNRIATSGPITFTRTGGPNVTLSQLSAEAQAAYNALVARGVVINGL